MILKTLSRNSEFNWFGDFCFGAVFDRFKQFHRKFRVCAMVRISLPGYCSCDKWDTEYWLFSHNWPALVLASSSCLIVCRLNIAKPLSLKTIGENGASFTLACQKAIGSDNSILDSKSVANTFFVLRYTNSRTKFVAAAVTEQRQHCSQLTIPMRILP